MNDKYFIEELRQKREQYGVTQTRLAVACGISREYYNRIEKGKFPLKMCIRDSIETTEIRYFSLQDLPHNLAEEKTNKEQIEMCFKAYLNENWQTQFD